MVVIKTSLNDPTKLFNLNDLDYPKGVYTIKYENEVEGSTDNIAISIVSKFNTNIRLVSNVKVTSFNDGTQDYSDLDSLISDLSSLLGFNNGGLTSITTGWGSYVDTQYTSGSPFVISANTDTVLPNNAGAIVDSQKPSDITTFYDGSVITGRNGDNLDVQIYFYAVPSLANQWLDVWIDITGGTGTPTTLAKLYSQSFSFPKGSGIERGVLYALSSAYTLNTWEINGGQVKVRTNGSLSVYGIVFNFDRSHKAI